MTDVDKRAVWDVLVEECGTEGDFMWKQFEYHWPCDEFRFQGDLGFGGKVYDDHPVRVACYPEDETPKRRAMIERANERLAKL